MKIYLVEISHANSDYTSIDKVFTTYHGASEYLIDEGFEPYCEYWFGEPKLCFSYEDDGWNDQYAKIIEMELEQ